MASLVRIEFKGFDKLKVGVKNALNQAISSVEIKGAIADEAVRQNVKALRSGKDIKGGQLPQKHKSYLEWLKILEKFNETSPFYKRLKSNATFTGQLLDEGIKYDFGPYGSHVVTIGFSDKKHKPLNIAHKKALTKKGNINKKAREAIKAGNAKEYSAQLSKKRVTFKQIAGWLEDKGWNLLDMSPRLEKSINRLVITKLRTMLRDLRRR